VSVVERIVAIRLEHARCAPVVLAQLKREAIQVSLSSVERTIRRQALGRAKRRTFVRPTLRRPPASYAGALLEIDTIHIWMPGGKRHYIYTLIDVATRWAYAEYDTSISAQKSAEFALRAQQQAPFRFSLVQSDNGSEFSKRFQLNLQPAGISWRHTRVRQSNDNAHIERFNRTLQEECFDGVNPVPKQAATQIENYLKYYNTERLHMGIDYQTPAEIVAKLLT
jgi:transposase InsO family protein